ncbi:Fur family transcriptional regulator [Thermosediminibacter litoriperuensis]|uniref:Fur family zinc uptake transcriptional regulator/Fur family ferric uptake transcriptional regulator n=1 Tax=Thermosediminibacter litoriperuensis TaxID=291989 RepID=A0A5S5AKR0_9FIRM|nr:Fur family transcriptional regulator [Thermosediminibacter litoriperuensis]TYP51677.1 Fur family zinc uptake transcriptional regulator/Fur family ferric uptake transcriptional regulator [Thermosediminibacter litoriperuensis]
MELENLLKQRGLKVTDQRKAIVKVLKDCNCMLSARDIFDKVKQIIPGVNFSTIYRNLDLMSRKGILCGLMVDTGVSLYGLHREEGHHHHLVCKGCGRSMAIDYCPMSSVEKELAKKGFSPTEHEFIVYGFCGSCGTSGRGE